MTDEQVKQRAAWIEKRRIYHATVDALGAHDLFQQKLEVGDTICWPTSAGRAVGITVGVITKITWKEERNRVSDRMYTVQARPLKAGYSGHYSTKNYTWIGEGENKTLRVEEKDQISPVTIQKVQNIVKVEVPPQQTSMEL